jgi:hypothetical protein
MERLLNFNEPLDVSLLDRVVSALYGRPEEVSILRFFSNFDYFELVSLVSKLVDLFYIFLDSMCTTFQQFLNFRFFVHN